jgi:hypothetical protein
MYFNGIIELLAKRLVQGIFSLKKPLRLLRLEINKLLRGLLRFLLLFILKLKKHRSAIVER